MTDISCKLTFRNFQLFVSRYSCKSFIVCIVAESCPFGNETIAYRLFTRRNCNALISFGASIGQCQDDEILSFLSRLPSLKLYGNLHDVERVNFERIKYCTSPFFFCSFFFVAVVAGCLCSIFTLLFMILLTETSTSRLHLIMIEMKMKYSKFMKCQRHSPCTTSTTTIIITLLLREWVYGELEREKCCNSHGSWSIIWCMTSAHRRAQFKQQQYTVSCAFGQKTITSYYTTRIESILPWHYRKWNHWFHFNLFYTNENRVQIHFISHDSVGYCVCITKLGTNTSTMRLQMQIHSLRLRLIQK